MAAYGLCRYQMNLQVKELLPGSQAARQNILVPLFQGRRRDGIEQLDIHI
jgi:hypothetical protein